MGDFGPWSLPGRPSPSPFRRRKTNESKMYIMRIENEYHIRSARIFSQRDWHCGREVSGMYVIHLMSLYIPIYIYISLFFISFALPFHLPSLRFSTAPQRLLVSSLSLSQFIASLYSFPILSLSFPSLPYSKTIHLFFNLFIP